MQTSFMAIPRLKEEEAVSALEDTPQSDLVRNLLAWVHDLLSEKVAPDTTIPWEDGEDRSSEAVED